MSNLEAVELSTSGHNIIIFWVVTVFWVHFNHFGRFSFNLLQCSTRPWLLIVICPCSVHGVTNPLRLEQVRTHFLHQQLHLCRGFQPLTSWPTSGNWQWARWAAAKRSCTRKDIIILSRHLWEWVLLELAKLFMTVASRISLLLSSSCITSDVCFHSGG